IIARAAISESAKARALEIFQALGAAEAKIHNIPVEQVHFHEVGAADAIVDIVCAAVGSEALHVDEWLCSPLNVGSGSVECAHGSFPVPAPATLELLQGAPIFSSGIQAELVTPTGAAIAKTLTSGALEVFATPVHMKKNRPGMLVTVLCRPAEEQKFAKLIFAETTTLGVRVREEKRRALPRKQVVVKTPWGEVRLKVAAMNGAI